MTLTNDTIVRVELRKPFGIRVMTLAQLPTIDRMTIGSQGLYLLVIQPAYSFVEKKKKKGSQSEARGWKTVGRESALAKPLFSKQN